MMKLSQPISPVEPSTSSLFPRTRGLHVMSKPIGPICNIDCKYCFYLEKEKLYPDTRKWRMPDDVLEEYIRQYIAQQDVPEISFAWQGGEPTLLGVDYFRNVVALQKRYANGKRIHNAFQTNGTLLNDEWGDFLSSNGFLVGLSIDGPRELHDRYRVDKKQNGTFDAVMGGLGFLKKHAVEFNTLTVVNRVNSHRPLEVYNFLKKIGSGFIQFIPLVERAASTGPLAVLNNRMSLDFAEPPIPGEQPDPSSPVTPWSVEAETYGQFLVTIFDQWVRHDVGRTFVQLFDVALGIWAGAGSSTCVFAEKCGRALAMEHNGDVYSCDHYVYPKYKLGNVMNASLASLVDGVQQRQFGDDKSSTLPAYCRKCEVRFACNGECPKHRFIDTPDGEAGLNYLCAAYKRFFHHVDAPMRTMTKLLNAGRAPAEIMSLLAAAERSTRSVSRNEPCACGSGRKFKNCCA
jgi:uncharacterized protein